MSAPDIRHLIASGHEVIASVSGGKDSTATALHLRDQGIPFRPVFMDTGWEHRDTYAYLRGPLEDAIGPITWLRAEVDLPPEREPLARELEEMLGHYSAMVRLCIRKMMVPARQVRWCTQAAKVEPMHRWVAALDTDVVSVVGIRHDESEARRKMEEWEWSDKLDRWTWRPIIRWTLDDVIAIHARHGLAPNPLYLRGATRVGCWPCIFARKAEIRMLADVDPERIAILRRLEEIIADLYRTTKVGSVGKRAARAAGWRCSECDIDWPDGVVTPHYEENVPDDDELTGPGGGRVYYDCDGERVWREATEAVMYQPPTWFQHNSERTPEMKEIGYAWPIDRVVEWSRTRHGGRQIELFAAADRDAGCMRWGLCDTGGGE